MLDKMILPVELIPEREAAPSGFRDIFRHSQPNVHHVYVALGENDSYSSAISMTEPDKHSAVSAPRGSDGQDITNESLAYQLGAYPGLQTYLRSNDSNPVCVALGENGHYFFHSENGASAWCLPQVIEEHIEPSNEDNPVEHLFLGKDDAYYARLSNGATRWNLRGSYGSLDTEVSHLTSQLVCLGMNPQDDRSCFMLTRDGGVRYNAGRAQFVDRGLTPQKFNTWVERFRSLRSG